MVSSSRSIHDLIQQELGVHAREQENPEGVASIGVASAQVLRPNPNRYAFVFVNLSGATMYLRPGRDASATDGIRLEANGGRLQVTWRDDFMLPARAWYAIATLAASPFLLLTMEGTP